MRTWKWMIGALLLITASAVGQQTATPASPDNAGNATQAAQPASAEPTNNATAPSTAPPPVVTAAPTTMDQVVDRAIEREHSLIVMLKARTPLVETYLQNVKFDPQMGPTPREDHYFFGRLDLSDSVDREDYLSKTPVCRAG